MTGRIFQCARRRESGRKPSHAALALALSGLGLTGLAMPVHPTPWLVWNASASAPVGLYRVLPGKAVTGDLVLVRTPDSVRKLAAERGYLPANIPLIKRIAAAGGDLVCACGNTIFINGRAAAERLARDRNGRPLPGWRGCRLLNSGEVFLLMQGVTDSFDSRYFGPIPATLIIGRLAPLWTG